MPVENSCARVCILLGYTFTQSGQKVALEKKFSQGVRFEQVLLRFSKVIARFARTFFGGAFQLQYKHFSTQDTVVMKESKRQVNGPHSSPKGKSMKLSRVDPSK